MHELAIAQGLLEQARDAARRSAPGRRVLRLDVETGELSGVVPAALRTGFRMLAAGTELAAARLRIRRVRARLTCRACARAFRPGAAQACPKCGSADVELVGGRGVRLASIEVEDG